MAAPEYVPVKPIDDARTYESPPWRTATWMATGRPTWSSRSAPRRRFGNQGPDQGYV